MHNATIFNAMAVSLATVTTAPAAGAQAQAPEVRFARQFSMGYRQFNLMEKHQLLEKHAKSAGIPDVKVKWATFNSPAAMNDALLSGSIDIVSGGVPVLLTIWAHTRGTFNAVEGIAAFSSQPILLNTRNPNIKTIADFAEPDKIALPAVKVSVQAIILQMAAAKRWGQANCAKLDAITVGMSPPDATVALLSGSGDITSNFSVPPFQYQQLQDPAIHTVLNSYDVFEGPHTFTVAWTSSQFRDKNSTLYKALIAAFEEATWAGMCKKPRGYGSKRQIEVDGRSGRGHRVRQGREMDLVPENTMRFAEFMHLAGTIKAKPTDWQELFFSDIHDLPGS